MEDNQGDCTELELNPDWPECTVQEEYPIRGNDGFVSASFARPSGLSMFLELNRLASEHQRTMEEP